MKPKIEARIATRPKNDIWACPKLSIKIRKEPENIPIKEPTIPISISNDLEILLTRLILLIYVLNNIYKFINQQWPEVLLCYFFQPAFYEMLLL